MPTRANGNASVAPTSNIHPAMAPILVLGGVALIVFVMVQLSKPGPGKPIDTELAAARRSLSTQIAKGVELHDRSIAVARRADEARLRRGAQTDDILEIARLGQLLQVRTLAFADVATKAKARGSSTDAEIVRDAAADVREARASLEEVIRDLDAAAR